MVCCVNPDCQNPQNPDGTNFCRSCGTKLVLLRSHYRVIQLLSDEGGFGRTYLAEDIDKPQPERCVVKQLAPKVQGTWAIHKSVQLFEQEALRLQQMGHHPQIPTLYAYFEQDKYLYLVQQWIEGQNLEKHLQQQGYWSESEIRDLLLDILPVLQFVHDRSVIHRDIKPANIIRRPRDGKFVLIDFGASKQLAATVVAKGTTIGTLGYAPIEQMQGGEAYPASDLFSLGATCFHLLTQVNPHLLFLNHGYDWVHNWRQHLRHPVGALTSSVLDKLLQKHQHQRYQSAAEVLNDLKKLPPPPPPPPPPVPPTVPSHGQSSPPPSTIISQQQNRWMGAIVILLLGLWGYWYWWLRPSETGFSSNPSQPTPSPTKTISNENSSLVNTLSGHSDSVNSVAISADGQTLVSGGGFSDGTIKIWNLSTGTLIRTLTGHSYSVDSVAISPDGQTLVSGSGDKTIKIWNLSTGTLIRTLTGHSAPVWSVAISPDGQTLVSGSYDNTIKIWNLSTGTLIRNLTGHYLWVSSVAISPDGQTLVSGSGDKIIKVWNLSTGTLIRTLTGHSNSVSSVAISPDGQTLVSGSWDNTIKIWNLSTGSLIRTLTGHSDSVNSVAISPDGQILVSSSRGDPFSSGDDTIKIWNLSTGSLIRTLTGHSDSVDSVAISPDGQTLVSGVGKTIKIWRVPK